MYVTDSNDYLIAASVGDISVGSDGNQVKATRANDTTIQAAAQFLSSVKEDFVSASPVFRVSITGHQSHWVQRYPFTDDHGVRWFVVTVQAVDCDLGSTVGADNQTWWVWRSLLTISDLC